MTAPFAALEQRLNSAVLSHLANASAVVGGGAPVDVIFDADYVLAEVGATGMAATAPAVTLPTARVPRPFSGVTVEVNYLGNVTRWRVAEHQPDGTGLSVLLLERTA